MINHELMAQQRAARLAAPPVKVTEPLQYNISKGNESDFWENVIQHSESHWEWTGAKTTNHNTREDIERYEYGHFHLEKCKSKLVHRVVLFITFGREVPDEYDVAHLDNNHLNISPENLIIRHKKDRVEWFPRDFYRSFDKQERQ